MVDAVVELVLLRRYVLALGSDTDRKGESSYEVVIRLTHSQASFTVLGRVTGIPIVNDVVK